MRGTSGPARLRDGRLGALRRHRRPERRREGRPRRRPLRTDGLRLLQPGDGTFEAPREHQTGRYPNAVAIGDLNGDGAPDLATANYQSNTVSVLANWGDGSFVARRDLRHRQIDPWSVAIGDLNGDGKPDVAAASESADDVSVLRTRPASARFRGCARRRSRRRSGRSSTACAGSADAPAPTRRPSRRAACLARRRSLARSCRREAASGCSSAAAAGASPARPSFTSPGSSGGRRRGSPWRPAPATEPARGLCESTLPAFFGFARTRRTRARRGSSHARSASRATASRMPITRGTTQRICGGGAASPRPDRGRRRR